MTVAAAIHRRKGAAREAQRILRRQIRKAQQLLAGARITDTDIHAARKHIKAARATLRLMRTVLPRAVYRRENGLLRDAAYPLSEARDAKILVEACDGLLHRSSRARGIAGARQLRGSLLAARRSARRQLLSRAGGLRRSRKLLRRARDAVGEWSVRRRSMPRLMDAAARLYGRGRAALQRVRGESSVATLHEWRKQSKYLYLQLETLAPVLRPQLGRLAQDFHTLSDELGEDHDLALLRVRAAERVAEFTHASGASEFATLIEHSRTALQRRALLLGARLYRPTRAGFARRLRRS
jgi:CHAD domain-containing protein